MNKVWAERWATYLENPNLRQTTGALCAADGRSRCCLGHAHAMLGNKFMQNSRYPGPELFPYDPITKKMSPQTLWLDKETQDLLGMKSSTGEFQDETFILYNREHCCSLVGLNDAGMPLKEIASVIREKWEVL